MITGHVANDGREAIVKLSVRGPTGRTLHIEVIVDTGFNGALSLDPQDIDDLRLHWIGYVVATLADDSSQMAETYSAQVLWDGRPQRITVTAMRGGPLVGMTLMRDYRLTIDVVPDGPLTLESLDSTNRN